MYKMKRLDDIEETMVELNRYYHRLSGGKKKVSPLQLNKLQKKIGALQNRYDKLEKKISKQEMSEITDQYFNDIGHE